MCIGKINAGGGGGVYMEKKERRVILFAKENIKEDEINVFDKLFYIQKLFKAAYHQIFPLSFLICGCTQNTIFRYMGARAVRR
jgi:hypothetical protein